MKNNPILKEIKILLEDKPKLFMLLYPYMLVIAIALGVYFVLNLNDVARQSVPPKLADTTAVVADLSVIAAKSVPAADLKAISQPSPELIENGKQSFQKLCASCHGESGNGAGPAAGVLNPAPRDFTSSENWINGQSVTGIFTSMEEGIPNSAMVAYDYLPTEEKFALLHYIRSTFIKNAPNVTTDEIAALDQTYNLSAGAEVPAQIPVADAINLIGNEHNKEIKKYESLFNEIKTESVPGSFLFQRVSNSPVQVLSILEKSSDWRKSVSSLNDFLLANIGALCFNQTVYNLSATELETLYTYLQKKV
ncbi:MAG: cytochrome c [Ignavibacteriaceae bacterium]|nr:cytochrome c [Ignavibacteriaceae bacterium]